MWEIAVHLAVAGGAYDVVFLCCPFSHEMSWMGSWTKLSQFLRVFLPTFTIFTKGGGIRDFMFALAVFPFVCWREEWNWVHSEG